MLNLKDKIANLEHLEMTIQASMNEIGDITKTAQWTKAQIVELKHLGAIAGHAAAWLAYYRHLLCIEEWEVFMSERLMFHENIK